jgi:hypothetical protein
MAEPTVPQQRRPMELPLVEARARFVQLIRLAGLARQTTIITESGRALGAIVPMDALADRGADASNAAAAGWLRRIEKLRADLRRQHMVTEQALEQAWQALDRLRPPGSDKDIDALRAAHAAVRRPR